MRSILRVLALILGSWTHVCRAAEPTDAPPRTLHADVVDDATLAGLSGRYYGANLLVGLRVDLVSTLSTPQGSATATGRLELHRTDAGYTVQIDTYADASADAQATMPAAGSHSATGASGLQIGGIGQVAQIAGDRNRMTNLTTIRFTPGGAPIGDAAPFNQQTTSSAGAGAMTAHITFLDGGLQLSLGGPGAQIGQHVGTGSGGLLQIGQIAAEGVVATNRMHLQPLSGAMPLSLLQQLGVQQALAGLAGLGR